MISPYLTGQMMPESERSGLYDPDEEFPWDSDLSLPLDEENEAEEDE